MTPDFSHLDETTRRYLDELDDHLTQSMKLLPWERNRSRTAYLVRQLINHVAHTLPTSHPDLLTEIPTLAHIVSYETTPQDQWWVFFPYYSTNEIVSVLYSQYSRWKHAQGAS